MLVVFIVVCVVVNAKRYSNLYNFSHDVYTEEEFLDTMERLNCRSQVHPLNVYGFMLELAKQELIQKSYIMVCSWKKHISLLKRYHEFKSFETVHKFYKESEPTTKVLALLRADPKSDSERQGLKYLQRYIRGLDKVFLLKYLRFVTGTNIASNISKLPVSFIKMQDFQRRLIAHTCGQLLEISDTYRNFCKLRGEFQHVLSANVWIFDTL